MELDTGFNCSFSRFSIHHVGSDHLGPILYEQPCVLRPKQVGTAKKLLTIRIKISAKMGSFGAGPVLKSQPLALELLDVYYRKRRYVLQGIVIHQLPSSSPIDTWMNSFAQATVIPLLKRASLMDRFVAVYKKDMEMQGCAISDLKLDLVIQSMLLDRVEDLQRISTVPLTVKNIDGIKRHWTRVQELQVVDPKVTNISPEVRIACLELHKKHRAMFQNKVTHMVIQDIVPHLRAKVQADLNKQMEAIKEQAEKEESSFTEKFRRSFATKTDDVPTLSVTRCINLQEKNENVWHSISKWVGLGRESGRNCSLSMSYNTEVKVCVF